MITYSLKVVDIRIETEDTITICFKQPLLRKIKYKAGQYLSLLFRINGRRYVRPYSFSSAPGMDNLIEITVKRVFQGLVSNYIHDHVKVNDVIEVIEPMGDFIFDSEISSGIVYLWGAGSGITPLISIAKQILFEKPQLEVRLIYGNRNSESIIFSTNIQDLLTRYSESFKVYHFHTNISVTENPPFLLQGRITKLSVLKIVSAGYLDNSFHYICGPLGLKESVKDALASLSVPDNHIFSEDFELVRDPKSFEDIQTQSVSLKFEDKNYELEVVKGKSILECALDAGIELPYSCQTGNCNTCKGNVKSGQLRMIGLTNKREDLLADEYLLCCSHPLTNDVYIEV